MASPAAEKLALFKSLFRGRTDVFPRRWETPRTGKSGYAHACRYEWVRGICGKTQARCGECPHQVFIPVGDGVLLSHLQGREPSGRLGEPPDFVVGVYPMLADETCWLIAADFDKASWARDALAFVDTCGDKGVPAVLERSRSGNGGHVGFFSPSRSRHARRAGSALLTETMTRCPKIGFDSYDRLFLSQDTMPSGGFGNLIALPFQRRPRENGNSVSIDQRRRQAIALHINLVAENKRQPLRERASDHGFGSAARGREGPRVGLLVGNRQPHAEDPACHGRGLV